MLVNVSFDLETGHVRRCLTFAQTWRQRGGEVLLLPLPGNTDEYICRGGFDVALRMPSCGDWRTGSSCGWPSGEGIAATGFAGQRLPKVGYGSS
ncbi:MAG TPA: hypothetical protein VMP00_08660 [Burkholderiales bacterium]|nr:hypothetical protein [Burkholderiales bacterium]